MTSPNEPERLPRRQAVRRVLLDNVEVLVTETLYPGGGRLPAHEEPWPHVLYVLDGGTLEKTRPDGRVTRLEARPGKALWQPPHHQSVRNVGITPVRVVTVEIKRAPVRIPGPRRPRASTPEELHWVPEPLDERRRTALLLGDPGVPGPYTIRSRCDAGYALGLHLRNEDEAVTVLSGAMGWSTGGPGSGEPEHVLPVGGFVLFPAGTPRRIWATEPMEIQISGIGPRTFRYLR